MEKRNNLLLFGAGMSWSATLATWIGATALDKSSVWAAPLVVAGAAGLLIGVLCLYLYAVADRRQDDDLVVVSRGAAILDSYDRFLSDRRRYQPTDQRIVGYSNETVAQYNERFAGDLLWLFDELVGLGTMAPDGRFTVELPTNLLGMEKVGRELKAGLRAAERSRH